jgi:hypothetical protein
MHLGPEELVDCAEGMGAESVERHLQSCGQCRQQVMNLRATMAAAVEVVVPEPSPLFWEHMSLRVREAIVADEPRRGRAWQDGWHSWRAHAWQAGVVAAAAAIVLAIFLASPRSAMPTSSVSNDLANPAATDLGKLQPLGSVDEPSLVLVAELTEQMDWDAAAETGMTSRPGGVDEVVGSLTDGERIELQRLLKEALARPGA